MQPTIEQPAAGATVTRGFIVTGKAPASWFRMQELKLQILDKDGKVLSEHPASTHERSDDPNAMLSFTRDMDWPKPFFNYDKEPEGPATLVVKQAENPSIDPAQLQSFSVAIVLSPGQSSTEQKATLGIPGSVSATPAPAVHAAAAAHEVKKDIDKVLKTAQQVASAEQEVKSILNLGKNLL